MIDQHWMSFFPIHHWVFFSREPTQAYVYCTPGTGRLVYAALVMLSNIPPLACIAMFYCTLSCLLSPGLLTPVVSAWLGLLPTYCFKQHLQCESAMCGPMGLYLQSRHGLRTQVLRMAACCYQMPCWMHCSLGCCYQMLRCTFGFHAALG